MLKMSSAERGKLLPHCFVTFSYLQGQLCVPHFRVSVAGPVHCLPPLDGGGLVQLRFRVWDPPLQVTEQGLHALQSDQPPFTEIGQ